MLNEELLKENPKIDDYRSLKSKPVEITYNAMMSVLERRHERGDITDKEYKLFQSILMEVYNNRLYTLFLSDKLKAFNRVLNIKILDTVTAMNKGDQARKTQTLSYSKENLKIVKYGQ